MRNSSIRNGWAHFVAGVLALAGVAAEARTLTLTAAQLHDPHASAEALRVIVEEHAGTASLHLRIGRAHAGWYYQDASSAWKQK